MCGRSCVRAFSPSSEQWSKACSSPAQPRRYAGVWAGPCGPGSRKSGSGCEREEKTERRPCETRPPFNGRRRAHGRAEALRPSVPPPPARAGARGRVRRVRVPRPTATRGESEPRPPPGAPGRSPGLARVSRPPPHAPAGLSSPGQGAPAWPGPEEEAFIRGRERHESAIRKGFCDREAEVLLFGFPGSKGGAAGACMGDAWW